MAMSPDKVSHAISFLMGEVHALFVATQTLARTHHDPASLLTLFDFSEQSGLAMTEGAPVPDAVVEGYQFAMAGLRKAIEVAAGTRRP